VPVPRRGPTAVPVHWNTWIVIAGEMGELTETSIRSMVAEIDAVMPNWRSPPATSGNVEFAAAVVLKEKQTPGALVWAVADVKTTTKAKDMWMCFIADPGIVQST
jgi:hypothetical protein